MSDKFFRIRLRSPTPAFLRVWAQICGLTRVWAEFVGAILIVSVLAGPIAPLSFVAALLTLGLPVVMLTLWGRSLDSEFGWSDRNKAP